MVIYPTFLRNFWENYQASFDKPSEDTFIKVSAETSCADKAL